MADRVTADDLPAIEAQVVAARARVDRTWAVWSAAHDAEMAASLRHADAKKALRLLQAKLGRRLRRRADAG